MKAARGGLAWSAALAGLVALPLVVAEPYVLNTLILVFYYAYLGQAWNLLGGYAGQLSLGHAAYFGVGAYASTLLFTLGGVSPWIGMWVGAALAALLGTAIGLLGFRFGLRGVYFSLLTLAACEILRVLVLHWDLAGGAVGIFLPYRGDAPALFQFKGRVPFYYVALAMMVGVTALVAWIARSPFGWRLMAVREDEEAALAVGVDAPRVKVAAIALSGGLTALGGTFYAQYYLNIHPSVVFATPLSIEILLRAFVGGAGTVVGPLIGAAVLTPFGELSRSALAKGGLEGLHLVLYGILLVVTVLFFPRGLADGFARLGRRLAAYRGAAGREGEPGERQAPPPTSPPVGGSALPREKQGGGASGAAAERERGGEPGSPPVGGSALPRESQGGGAASAGGASSLTALLDVRDLIVRYGDIPALHGVSLAVAERETVAVIGANGAGKTTLMRALAGLTRPAAGEIRLAGERVDGRPPHHLVEMGLVLIPEGRVLFPTLTVRENLDLGATVPRARDGREARLERVLALFPRLAERSRQAAGTLSGGEQQMVAVGRGLMAAPRLLLVDEPSQGLAPLVVRVIFGALRRVAEEGVTVLLVEQNARQALTLAARGIVLESGRVAREGPSAALLADEAIKRAYLGM